MSLFFFRPLLAALWLLVLAPPALAAEPVAIPKLSARVTDLTSTLTAEQRAALETSLAAIEQEKGAQVGILLLPTVKPETIEEFGIRLADAWKLGRKGVDDGVIVIVAKNDRKMRIEVGYGLEGAIPDAVAKRIIAERMAPAFKQGDFAGGLAAAVAEIDAAIGGDSAEAAPAAEAGTVVELPVAADNSADTYGQLVMAILLGTVLSLFIGKTASVLTTLMAGLIGWLGFGTAVGAATAAAVGLFFSALAASLRGRVPAVGWMSSGSGSGSGSWSSSSDSSDSFSGGGGDFGGGGASGDW